MRPIASLLLLAAAGCGARQYGTHASEQEQVQETVQQTIQRYRVTAEDERQIKRTYPDLFLHVQDWREAVLDHADRLTLLHLRTVTAVRLRDLEAQDRELAFYPPYVVIDARDAVKDQLEFEVERLRLIEDRLETVR